MLKLTIELVPRPLWYLSLYNLLPRKEWDRLRNQVYAQYDYHCGICGVDGRMNCHEIWEYDDVNHIQRLAGLIALCNMCNHCKHILLSGTLARQGKLDLKAVVVHFCRVNRISMSEFIPIRRSALKQWNERSKHEWTQDFGEYSSLIVP